jgi:hypothetical protein
LASAYPIKIISFLNYSIFVVIGTVALASAKMVKLKHHFLKCNKIGKYMRENIQTKWFG